MRAMWTIQDQYDAICKVVILALRTSTKLDASHGPRITKTEEDIKSGWEAATGLLPKYMKAVRRLEEPFVRLSWTARNRRKAEGVE